VKKYVLILLLMISALISGCNVRELSFDRVYPETEGLEIAREKRQAEIDEILNATSLPYLINSPEKPNPLYISSSKDSKFLIAPLQHCWRETVEECAHLQPINIYTDERFDTQYAFALRIAKFIVKPFYEIQLTTNQ
jgi:hypothetical protein